MLTDTLAKRLLSPVNTLPFSMRWATFLSNKILPFRRDFYPNSLFYAYPQFALELLRVVNSPAYSGGNVAGIDVALLFASTAQCREAILSPLSAAYIAPQEQQSSLDYAAFFRYSLFCAVTAEVLAEKIGYRFPEEAATAAALHDIGVPAIALFLPDEFEEICSLMRHEEIPLPDAEQRILGVTHCDIGSYIAQQCGLPARLGHAIRFHHSPGAQFAISSHSSFTNRLGRSAFLDGSELQVSHPLTAVVALTEWFAGKMGFKLWLHEKKQPLLNIPAAIFHKLGAHSLLDADSALDSLTPLLHSTYNDATDSLKNAFA